MPCMLLQGFPDVSANVLQILIWEEHEPPGLEPIQWQSIIELL